jgi:uncharacterized membrane protein YczE
MKKVIQMLISVILMGVCVSILVMTKFGPDPASAMNYGMARLVGLPFGTYQLCFNIALFLVILAFDKSLLGLGTFGNMILVGFSADFTTWLVGKIFGTTEIATLGMRVLIMIPALIIFVIAASVYMNSDLGTAPYDALPYLIHKRLCKRTGKELKFRIVRMVYDGAVTLFAFCIKGEVGLVTVLMVLSLGPAIDAVDKLLHPQKRKKQSI